MVPFRGSRTNLQSIICLIFAWFAVVYLQTCFGQNLCTHTIASRVGGGAPAEEERFPYMCSVRNKTQGHGCGGTLINRSWVMTAAHCLDFNCPNSNDKCPDFYCGIQRLDDDACSKVFRTKKCVIHHNWTRNVVDGSDIALCELDRASGGRGSFPNLMKSGVAVSANDIFSVVGWGYFDASLILAEELQEGKNVPFVSNSMCNLRKYWQGRITDSMICAGLDGVDTCRGDSGGPLLIPRERVSSVCDGSSNRDCIVGVTSFGNETCNAELPGVYTLVSCYRSWIDCIIQGLGQTCNSRIPCEELSFISPDSPATGDVDGSIAPTGRFPYMCSIRRTATGSHICGATLIASRWIMTGAVCLESQFPGSAGLTPFIYCGIIDREDQDPTKRFVTTKCYLHHLWTGSVLDGNDIALCKLDRASNAAIPNVPITEDTFSRNNELTFLGWGNSESSRAPAEKLKMISDLRLVANTVCNQVPIFSRQITESMICAGEGSQAPCEGDGGGPLLLPNRKDNSVNSGDASLDLIIGIASFGSPTCDDDVPDVFTRVSCYRSWMNCIMEDTGNDCSVHIPCK